MSFTIRLEGIPFDGVNDTHLYAAFASLKNLLASIGKSHGNDVALWTTIKRQKIEFNRNYTFNNTFSKQFAQKYLERFNTADYFENVFYITLLLKCDDIEDGIDDAEKQISMLMKSLKSYDPYLLTAYQNEQGVIFSEVYEFFASLINGCHEQVPLGNSDAYQKIGNATLHFGSQTAEIRNNQSRKFAVMYDLRDFGISKPKILTKILELESEFTLTQSFVYINSATMQSKIDKQLNNLTSVGDQAIEQQQELMAGKGQLQAGELMFGDYHAALVVFGNTAKKARDNGTAAKSILMASGGFDFTLAGMSAPSTYFSQVPGSKEKPRNFPVTTENLACTFGMHNYSHGKSRGNPIGDGTAIMPLQTVSNTVYDFNFHFSKEGQDNTGEKIAGHTLILGSTGTGKTTLETALLSFTERFNPFLFAADLDRGMEIFIRAIGGAYFSLQAGVPTGLNPFQLPDTPANREFLYELVGVCAENPNAEERKEIKVAVDTVMNIDFAHRNFSVLLESIPFKTDESALRTRLAEWSRKENGRFATWLDNEVNQFNPDEFYRIGFDLTDILKDNYKPTAPVMLYLFHLRDLMMQRVAKQDGILCSVIEEFWYPARYPVMQEKMLKMLKTDRKIGGWVILVSQSPEDAINSPIFSAIVEQTPTKIFLPNPDAKFAGSYELCGMSEKEYQTLITKTLDCREFLVKQSKQSAFAKLDLHGFDVEMTVLSGDSSNVAILDSIIQRCGTNQVQTWYPIFIEEMKKKIASKKAKEREAIERKVS